MAKSKRHLALLSPHVETLRRGETAEQFGTICFRPRGDGMVEVLLITTRETGRWTIPKGWPIKGLKPHQVAEREAWEEAGIKGKVKKASFGYYSYLKTLVDGSVVPSIVEVHLLRTEQASEKFPERGQRLLEWMVPEEAAFRVQEPELKGLFRKLAERSFTAASP
ncbi:NUDIX hydrolase [Rhizobium sp. LEGMi198b]